MSGLRKGDLFVAYADKRPANQVFIEVTRVAKDGTWADIIAQTWAVQWRKRQPLRDGTLPYAEKRYWSYPDIRLQQTDWERKSAATPPGESR